MKDSVCECGHEKELHLVKGKLCTVYGDINKCPCSFFRPAPSQPSRTGFELDNGTSGTVANTHYPPEVRDEKIGTASHGDKDSTERGVVKITIGQSKDEKIARIMKEFREKFPLLRVYPKVGQEIERFCDEEIEDWLTQTLTTLLNEE